MIILAIDPGPKESGYVIVSTTHGLMVGERGIVSNQALLARLGEDNLRAPAHLVIERVAGMGMPVGESTFETVFWTGRFYQAWRGAACRIKRHEVKMHLCGNMRAKDANIRQALIDKYGPMGTKKQPGILYGIHGHLWSALALADTFLAQTTPEFA